jgi:uncharacterized protein (DUF1697 family)
MKTKTSYIGFLRGINVGGHHKVPMAQLRERVSEIGCVNVRTLLNSGNIVFDTETKNLRDLELEMEEHLSKSFGFAIPFVVRTKEDIIHLVQEKPFKTIAAHKDIRLYVSFLKENPSIELALPYFSKDNGYKIISMKDRIICSVLDLSVTETTKGMEELEKLFGKNITTRNWNTVLKISDN